MVKLAVFDIDGTIFRSSLTVELVNGFFDAGLFPKKAKKDMETHYLAWMNRKGKYKTFAQSVVKILFKHIKGFKKKDVKHVVSRVIAWQKDRVYIYTRELIKELKKKSYYLIAISGSPLYIVHPFAKRIGFNEAFGIVYEIKNGRFTGRVKDLDPVIKKEKVLQKFIATSNLNIDLDNSVAVGDTSIDIPMLEMVGKPIAFNPNKELAEYAKKKNWKIIVERKDVIYHIKKFSFER